MIVVADTSALLAAFDATEAEHARARQVMSSELLVISPFVLTVLDHLIRRSYGFTAALEAVESLTDRIADGDYRLASVSNDDLVAAAEVRSSYAGLELDLTDAVGVVLADHYRTNRIFTLDRRDFRTVKPLTSGYDHFTLLPADA